MQSGNYQASFKDLSGSIQPAPQTYSTREAADRFLTQKQAEQIAAIEAQKSGRWLLDTNRGAIPFGDYAKRYFDTKQDWSERIAATEFFFDSWIGKPWRSIKICPSLPISMHLPLRSFYILKIILASIYQMRHAHHLASTLDESRRVRLIHHAFC